MRRHHLIEEAKAELDVAYEEVKRAEFKIMSLEEEYNARLQGDADLGSAAVAEAMKEKEALQDRLNIQVLYELQASTVERFSLVSAAFALVGTVDDNAMCLDLIRNILFRPPEIREKKVEIDRALRGFIKGLKAYSKEESNEDNDAAVREYWSTVEELLRGFGRDF